MKLSIIVLVLTSIFLSFPSFAADTSELPKSGLEITQCVEDKIVVQQLRQERELLMQQLMQVQSQFGQLLQQMIPAIQIQYRYSEQQQQAAKIEQERLQKLLSTPTPTPEQTPEVEKK